MPEIGEKGAVLSPLRALGLLVAGAVFEVVTVLPWVDRVADQNETVHFTQHGFSFLGGVAMGYAIRELHRR
jgi:hypothetical protein